MTLFHSNDMTYFAIVEKLCAMRRSALDSGEVKIADAIGRRLHLMMLIHTAKTKGNKQRQIDSSMLERNPAKQLKRKAGQTMQQAAILRIADIISSKAKLALKTSLVLARSTTLSLLCSGYTLHQLTQLTDQKTAFLRWFNFQKDSFSLLSPLQLSSEHQKIPVH